MANKMLIDAAHPEETRVVVLRGNRVEEFDFESANRRQLRGNIYLAKVTRVEPSLQAAFVDYGGNRHGFLAFSEIHPDYYQIPVADRQALIAEDERAHRAAEAEHESRARPRPAAPARTFRSRPRDAIRSDVVEGRPTKPRADEICSPKRRRKKFAAETAAFNARRDVCISRSHARCRRADHAAHEVRRGEPATISTIAAEDHRTPVRNRTLGDRAGRRRFQRSAERGSDFRRTGEADQCADDDDDDDDSSNVQTAEVDEEDIVESVGGADALEEVPDRAPRYRRQYKIQEVIKRRQIMLVQVVKEERGTKGAALTTYLSLAGRYSVLMPNTARGGGISRKITNSQDRARLKEAASELEVPEGMGVILRTAGAARTPTRDQARFRIPAARVGNRARSDAAIDRADARL